MNFCLIISNNSTVCNENASSTILIKTSKRHITARKDAQNSVTIYDDDYDMIMSLDWNLSLDLNSDDLRAWRPTSITSNFFDSL